MLASIDGKVTGDFLYAPECSEATELYYEINRAYGADAYACGRVTMQESFTKGYFPSLDGYEPCSDTIDFVSEDANGFYAVAFDPHARLGWKGSRIIDEDDGYGNAHIIEVLTESVDPRYLTYLREMNISYIFAGKDSISVATALEKLYRLFNIKTLLLEGGSIINGAFLREELVDEISLVVAPLTASSDSKPLFFEGVVSGFALCEAKSLDGGVLRLLYKR